MDLRASGPRSAPAGAAPATVAPVTLHKGGASHARSSPRIATLGGCAAAGCCQAAAVDESRPLCFNSACADTQLSRAPRRVCVRVGRHRHAAERGGGFTCVGRRLEYLKKLQGHERRTGQAHQARLRTALPRRGRRCRAAPCPGLTGRAGAGGGRWHLKEIMARASLARAWAARSPSIVTAAVYLCAIRNFTGKYKLLIQVSSETRMPVTVYPSLA